jgi:magnesium-transporting ATPase (P-type)
LRRSESISHPGSPGSRHAPLANEETLLTNQIRTCKYTWWNFLPKNLFQQFKKLANIFFLLVLALQVIKPISISGGQPNILLPLLVVIGMSAAKDFLEDRKRKMADKEENESLVEVIPPLHNEESHDERAAKAIESRQW